METSTEVYVWGSNQCGQQGLGSSQKQKANLSALFLSHNIRIRQVSCGSEHSAFISYSGLAYSMGSNESGRLGVNSRLTKHSSSPCLVESLPKLKFISCGGGHTIAISKDGRGFSWGEGEFGALGTGSVACAWQPVQIKLPIKLESASCGSRHTVLLGKSAVYVTGAGESGQLGTGLKDREIWPTSINLKSIKQAAAGVFHTLFVSKSGDVFATGGNSFGQLGTGTRSNVYSPVRLRSLENTRVEKVMAGSHSACISADGSLYVWGVSALGDFLLPSKVNIGPVRNADVGGSFGTAIALNGSVFTWGNNSNGELAQGNTLPQCTPVLVHSLQDKLVREIACGNNFCIALGGDITRSSVSSGKRRGRTTRSEKVVKHKKNLTPDITKRRKIKQYMSKNVVVLPACRTEKLPSRMSKEMSIDKENTLGVERLQPFNTEKLGNISVEKTGDMSDYIMASRVVNQPFSHSEADRLRRELDDLKIELEHKNSVIAELERRNNAPEFARQVEEQRIFIENLQRTNEEWEIKCRGLETENAGLRENIKDLEGRSRQTFKCIGRELSQRARDYRERTEHMLQTTSLVRRCEEYQSPMRVAPPPARHTPSKEEIQARINELMHKHTHNESILAKINDEI